MCVKDRPHVRKMRASERERTNYVVDEWHKGQRSTCCQVAKPCQFRGNLSAQQTAQHEAFCRVVCNRSRKVACPIPADDVQLHQRTTHTIGNHHCASAPTVSKSNKILESLDTLAISLSRRLSHGR